MTWESDFSPRHMLHNAGTVIYKKQSPSQMRRSQMRSKQRQRRINESKMDTFNNQDICLNSKGDFHKDFICGDQNGLCLEKHQQIDYSPAPSRMVSTDSAVQCSGGSDLSLYSGSLFTSDQLRRTLDFDFTRDNTVKHEQQGLECKLEQCLESTDDLEQLNEAVEYCCEPVEYTDWDPVLVTAQQNSSLIRSDSYVLKSNISKCGDKLCQYYGRSKRYTLEYKDTKVTQTFCVCQRCKIKVCSSCVYGGRHYLHFVKSYCHFKYDDNG